MKRLIIAALFLCSCGITYEPPVCRDCVPYPPETQITDCVCDRFSLPGDTYVNTSCAYGEEVVRSCGECCDVFGNDCLYFSTASFCL